MSRCQVEPSMSGSSVLTCDPSERCSSRRRPLRPPKYRELRNHFLEYKFLLDLAAAWRTPAASCRAIRCRATRPTPRRAPKRALTCGHSGDPIRSHPSQGFRARVVRTDEILIHRVRDVIADHHKADQRTGPGVPHHPGVRHGSPFLVGLGEDVLHRIEVLVLSQAAAKGHDERTILRPHNVAQSHPHHFWPSMRLRPSGLLVLSDQRNCRASLTAQWQSPETVETPVSGI